MDKECKDEFCTESGTPILGMVLKIPLGEYSVKCCGKGAHSVSRVRTGAFKPDLSIIVQESILDSNTKIKPDERGNVKISSEHEPSQQALQRIKQWFQLYFTDPIKFEKSFPEPFEICVPTATDLQKEVWKTLQKRVSFGNTVSYGELADYANRPKAARAIGSAMKNNPNCIIVPCHRVIKASSEIGNYNGGADIKIWLLNHEKEMRTNVKLAESA